MAGSLADELGRAAIGTELPSVGFAQLLASANKQDVRNALAAELWRLRWDRRKLKSVWALKAPEAVAHFQNARANLEYYLARTPPVSSHHYYMHGEPVAELWCGCGDDQGLCPLHAALLARS